MRNDAEFYRRWILANCWSEAVGLGGTFVVGRLAAPLLDARPSAATVIGGALGAVVLGALLEGALVGFAQERVLRKRMAHVAMPERVWMSATAIGAGLAWLLGMIPSTLMALGSLGVEEPTTPEPSRVVQYAMAVVMGLATGPILGLAQWTVLKRYVPRASRWLWANALAWASGMLVIFVGMDLMLWNGPPLLLAVGLCLVCGLAGLVVGAIHGRVLLGLTSSVGTG